jgi:mannosyltransferase
MATLPPHQPHRPQISIRPLYRWLPIFLILLVSAVLFRYRLDAEGLWLDELTSIQDADLSVVEAYKENQLRPLYYFLLMGWMHFGRSDAWLRSLSVIFAIISVFLIYRLGRRLVGEAEGLIAAALLTVSPLFINHAQEIRMYVLSLCLGLAGTLFLTEAVLTERPQPPSTRQLAGWTLFRLLAILTVPLNVTLLLADAVIIILRFRQERPALISFGKWLLLLILLWIPSLLSVIQESTADSTYAAHHVGAVPPGLDRLARSLKFLTVWPFEVQKNAIAANFYKSFVLVIAGLVGASLIRKHKSPNLVWLCVWFVLPLLPILAFSYLSIPIWESRYLLFVTPYLFILLAAGFTRLWQQWKIAAVVMAALYLIAVGGGLTHYYTVQDRPDYKFNIATLEAYEQPGDAIVWSYFYKKALKHYYDGNTDIHWLPVRDVKTAADIQPWLSQFPPGYERWWLVIEPKPIAAELEGAIANAYTIEKTFVYEQGSKVMLLTPRNPPSAPQ